MNIKDIKAGMLILFKARKDKENEKDDLRLALTDYDKTSKMVFCRRVFRYSSYDKYDRGTYIQLVDAGSDKNIFKGYYYNAYELYADCDAIHNITQHESRMSEDGEFDDTVSIVAEGISQAVIDAIHIFSGYRLGSDSALIVPNKAVENDCVEESLHELSKIYKDMDKLYSKKRVEEFHVMKEIVNRTFFCNHYKQREEC